MPKELSAGAVVFRENNDKIEYLLLHYGAGHWGFPKGHVEANESPEQTVKREVLEETSLSQISIVPGFKEKTSYFFRSRRETIYKEVIFHLIKANNGEVKISFEHTDFKWLPFQEAIKLLSFESTKQVLRKANEFLLQSNLGEFS